MRHQERQQADGLKLGSLVCVWAAGNQSRGQRMPSKLRESEADEAVEHIKARRDVRRQVDWVAHDRLQWHGP